MKNGDMRGEKNPLVQKGKYQVQYHPSGAATIYLNGKEIGYCPSKERMRQRFFELNSKYTWHSRKMDGLKAQLQCAGVAFCGRRSIPLGREYYGLPHPTIKTKEGKEILLHVSLEEIKATIRDYWPANLIESFKQGKIARTDMPKIMDYMGRHWRSYHSAQRKFKKNGGFAEIFDSVYPGVYHRIRRRISPKHIDRTNLRDVLRVRYSAGQVISPGRLCKSATQEERNLGRQIKLLAKQSLGMDPVSVVMQFTGLSRKDITLDEVAMHENGTFAEKLTEFLIRWAFITGFEMPFLEEGKVLSKRHELTFIHKGKNRWADLRVKNNALEVKVINYCDEPILRELSAYAPGEIKWITGERIERSLVFMHQEKSVYRQFISELKEAGIEIIGYEEFHPILGELVAYMQKNCRGDLDGLKPKPNLPYIFQFHEEMSLAPNLFHRPGNMIRKEWTGDMLDALINKAKELENA